MKRAKVTRTVKQPPGALRVRSVCFSNHHVRGWLSVLSSGAYWRGVMPNAVHLESYQNEER